MIVYVFTCMYVRACGGGQTYLCPPPHSQKWGGTCPPAPPASYASDNVHTYIHNYIHTIGLHTNMTARHTAIVYHLFSHLSILLFKFK